MTNRIKNITLGFFILFIAIAGCKESVNQPMMANLAPDTEIFLFPDDFDSLVYRVRNFVNNPYTSEIDIIAVAAWLAAKNMIEYDDLI